MVHLKILHFYIFFNLCAALKIFVMHNCRKCRDHCLKLKCFLVKFAALESRYCRETRKAENYDEYFTVLQSRKKACVVSLPFTASWTSKVLNPKKYTRERDKTDKNW